MMEETQLQEGEKIDAVLNLIDTIGRHGSDTWNSIRKRTTMIKIRRDLARRQREIARKQEERELAGRS